MRKFAVALALVALASVGAIGTSAQPAAAAVAQAKVVIVVGATGSVTSSYRSDADAAAAVFAKYTTNIVKVYSPNATWAAVQAAAVGAAVLVYMGHGSGYPNPYVGYLQPNGDNGMGLNATAGNGDSNTKYYGENYMATLNLAPNSVVLLNHLCYASGDSEWGAGLPSLATAETRVDGYASGFLRGNARAVIAEGVSSLSPAIDGIFSAHETLDQLWKSYNFHNHVTSWSSTRNSGYTSQIDPDIDHPASDGDYYYRSMVSLPGLTTDMVGQLPTYAATTYVPITPVRLLDTRAANGLSGRISANTPAIFQVTGRGGIPASATAVTGNLTVVNPDLAWALYLGPWPTTSPTSSTINFKARQTASNGVTVALGIGGTLSATYMSVAGATTDLVFDVTGYFVPNTTGATFHPMTPARLLDTRYGTGLSGGLPATLDANTPLTFQVTGRAGIPSSATAVTGNLTVTGATFSWAMYLGPVANPSPTTSSINFQAGEVASNNLTVALGAGGKLSATYISTDGNTTDLVFDVTGYYTPDATGARYTPLNPVRLLDTRYNNGLSAKLAANTPVAFQVSGRGGLPSSATGITGNLTVTGSSYGWAIFVGPDPTSAPATSTVNFNAGEVTGNGLAVKLGTGGTLNATYISESANTTDLVLDVTGYFAP